MSVFSQVFHGRDIDVSRRYQIADKFIFDGPFFAVYDQKEKGVYAEASTFPLFASCVF